MLPGDAVSRKHPEAGFLANYFIFLRTFSALFHTIFRIILLRFMQILIKMSTPEKKCNGSSARLGVRGRARVRTGVRSREFGFEFELPN